MSCLISPQTQLQKPGGLTGKLTLITDKSRALGPAIARRLAKEGTSVAISYAVSTFFWSIVDHVVKNFHYFVH